MKIEGEGLYETQTLFIQGRGFIYLVIRKRLGVMFRKVHGALTPL